MGLIGLPWGDNVGDRSMAYTMMRKKGKAKEKSRDWID
jgi:hypothetical protein